MSREQQVMDQVVGTVIEAVPNDLFCVRLDSGTQVMAHISEESRLGIVRLRPGDRVVLRLMTLDPSRARIVGLSPGRKHESIGIR